ncbi:MAG: HTH domain-containing protein [Methylococcales bacterium]|nr:HTH domain-containing protein [Methylococcales bacterium]
MNNRVTSRQYQILELLMKNRAGLSIDEIANTLSISRNAVQQHFSSLERDDFIRTGEQKKTAGRPVRTFIITEAGINCFPKQYAWFSELILTDLKDEMGEENFKRYLQKLGTSLSLTLQSRFDNKPIDERIHELIKIMEDLGYQASSTKITDTDDHYIEACNCIYHDLAFKFNAVCELDKKLISNLLDKKVELVECMATGGHVCKFKVKNK